MAPWTCKRLPQHHVLVPKVSRPIDIHNPSPVRRSQIVVNSASTLNCMANATYQRQLRSKPSHLLTYLLVYLFLAAALYNVQYIITYSKSQKLKGLLRKHVKSILLTVKKWVLTKYGLTGFGSKPFNCALHFIRGDIIQFGNSSLTVKNYYWSKRLTLALTLAFSLQCNCGTNKIMWKYFPTVRVKICKVAF